MRYLEHGDIITIEGVRYYAQGEADWPCQKCHLRGALCDKYFGSEGPYDCASNGVTIRSAASKIEDLRKAIEYNEALIKRLEGDGKEA